MSESFEREMLLSLKRATEEEMLKEQNQEKDQVIASREKTDFQDSFEESLNTSNWSTYKMPPPMQPQVYYLTIYLM